MERYNLKQKLTRYIDAGFPIIYIHGFEEGKIDRAISYAAGGRRILEWNGLNGFVDFNTKTSLIEDKKLFDTLELLKMQGELERSLLVVKDGHSLLDDLELVALIRGLANRINEGLDTSIIFVSEVVNIPQVLEKYVTVLEVDTVDRDEVQKVIQRFIEENELRAVNAKLLEEMSIAFKGLSEFEINNILALAYADDGNLSRKDLKLIFDQKQQIIKKSGILDMIPLRETIDDIGGLKNLKQWLERKSMIYKNIVDAQKFGVDMPKGVLIAGVPGCGKSLSAKAAANLFEVPLLRLDMGRLMGKYVGESESNMRKAIKLAETISPCVLWIDELEKAFAGIGSSSNGAEVTMRLFGYFLTWLQEKESAVFVVATANDIINLPPELLRKGRFDEVYYVGLPNETERKSIFEIHIRKRREKDLKQIDIQKLVKQSEGYSGADIEGVIKESIEVAFSRNQDALKTEDILHVLKNTHSLSEIMKESLEKITEIYENRKFKNASN